MSDQLPHPYLGPTDEDELALDAIEHGYYLAVLYLDDRGLTPAGKIWPLCWVEAQRRRVAAGLAKADAEDRVVWAVLPPRFTSCSEPYVAHVQHDAGFEQRMRYVTFLKHPQGRIKLRKVLPISEYVRVHRVEIPHWNGARLDAAAGPWFSTPSALGPSESDRQLLASRMSPQLRMGEQRGL